MQKKLYGGPRQRSETEQPEEKVRGLGLRLREGHVSISLSRPLEATDVI